MKKKKQAVSVFALKPITRNQKNLFVALLPYQQHWHRWKNSPHCFLSEKEVRIAEAVLSISDAAKLCSHVKLKQRSINLYLRGIRFKLQRHYGIYLFWAAHIYGRKNSPAQFLRASFHSRFYSRPMARFSARLGKDMFEVLCKHPEAELINKFKGKRVLFKAFKILLKINNCSGFL